MEAAGNRLATGSIVLKDFKTFRFKKKCIKGIVYVDDESRASYNSCQIYSQHRLLLTE